MPVPLAFKLGAAAACLLACSVGLDAWAAPTLSTYRAPAPAEEQVALAVLPAEEVEPAEPAEAEPLPPMTMQASVAPLAGCAIPTETHGTGVAWDRNPVTAFQRAAQENKLVFLLHLSGNFNLPEET